MADPLPRSYTQTPTFLSQTSAAGLHCILNKTRQIYQNYLSHHQWVYLYRETYKPQNVTCIILISDFDPKV